ncbi:unnamed protein product [Closterium sp. NIES-64]|nr:unnamed protein product [Closterium sp. NIES-64]
MSSTSNVETLEPSDLPLLSLPDSFRQRSDVETLEVDDLPLSSLPDSSRRRLAVGTLKVEDLTLSSLPGFSRQTCHSLVFPALPVVPATVMASDSFRRRSAMETLEVDDLPLSSLLESSHRRSTVEILAVQYLPVDSRHWRPATLKSSRHFLPDPPLSSLPDSSCWRLAVGTLEVEDMPTAPDRGDIGGGGPAILNSFPLFPPTPSRVDIGGAGPATSQETLEVEDLLLSILADSSRSAVGSLEVNELPHSSLLDSFRPTRHIQVFPTLPADPATLKSSQLFPTALGRGDIRVGRPSTLLETLEVEDLPLSSLPDSSPLPSAVGTLDVENLPHSSLLNSSRRL